MRRTVVFAVLVLALALLACGNKKKKCLDSCDKNTAASLSACSGLDGQAKEMCEDTIKDSIAECRKICEESY